MNLNLIFTTKNLHINSNLYLLSNSQAGVEALILKLDDNKHHPCQHENNTKEGNEKKHPSLNRKKTNENQDNNIANSYNRHLPADANVNHSYSPAFISLNLSQLISSFRNSFSQSNWKRWDETLFDIIENLTYEGFFFTKPSL